jgi:hypothetical protein
MAASDYMIRINVQDGLLEITGPDREWVDAKVEQLKPMLVSAPPAETPAGGSPPKRPVKRTRSRIPDASAEAGGITPPPVRRVRSSGRSEVNTDLRDLLTPEVRLQFKGYIDARRKPWDKSLSAQAAIIATYLHDELDHAGVDQHDLYTVYTVMGERIPKNIRSQLTNARQRAHYFSGLQDGKMVLSHAGENYARHDAVVSDGNGDA